MDPKIGVLALWNLQRTTAKSIFSWGIPNPMYPASGGGIKFYFASCLGAAVMVRSTVGVV